MRRREGLASIRIFLPVAIESGEWLDQIVQESIRHDFRVRVLDKPGVVGGELIDCASCRLIERLHVALKQTALEVSHADLLGSREVRRCHLHTFGELVIQSKICGHSDLGSWMHSIIEC